jgi:hypothetical protein
MSGALRWLGTAGFGRGVVGAGALALVVCGCHSEELADSGSGSGGAAAGSANDAGGSASPEQEQSSVACAEQVGDWCKVLVTEMAFSAPQFLVGVDHAGNVVSVGEEGAPDARVSQVQVAKYAPDGKLLWRRAFGGRNHEVPRALAINATDDIFIVGSDAAPDGLGRYPFIMKVSADGELLWMQLASNIRDAQQAFGVAVAASGSAVMVLETGAVVKYSAGGERVWVAAAGNKTWGADVVVDGAGASFVLRAAEGVSFLTKLSSGGELEWERNLGERGMVDLAFDSNGNLWTLGSEGQPRRPHLARYSAEGELLWSGEVASEQTTASSLALDTNGNVFVIGKEAAASLSERFGAYVTKYDAEGSLQWGEALGLDGGSGARDLAVAADGTVFVTGDYPAAPTGAFIVRMSLRD